ncbi:MAG: hypothetical protein QNJ37_12025 [Crocosphaera sp.]|nr:hypothetical protein [Crocosphaera sp.]
MLDQSDKQLIVFALSTVLKQLDSDDDFVEQYQEYVEGCILNDGYSPHDYNFDNLADELITKIEHFQAKFNLKELVI